MANVSTAANVPETQLKRIKEVIPETRYMSNSRILRYALSRTIGLSHEDAMKACQDTRSKMARSVLEADHSAD